MRSSEELLQRVRQLQSEGKVRATLNDEDRIDWVYGTTAIENDAITRELVTNAFKKYQSA